MLVAFATFGQNLPVIPVNSAWIQKIESLAPQQTRFPSSGTKKVLLFSLHTGCKGLCLHAKVNPGMSETCAAAISL